MTDFVSKRWMRVAAMAAPMSVVSFVFILQGSPWSGLVWLGLTLPIVLWTMRATPVNASAQPSRAAYPAAGLRK